MAPELSIVGDIAAGTIGETVGETAAGSAGDIAAGSTSNGSISVIGMGVSDFYRPAANRAEARDELTSALADITKPFVLYVGGDDERKNVDGAIRAWAAVPIEVRQARQLVIACSASATTRSVWTAVATEAGLRAGDMVITGFVRNETLRALYQTAELQFFASFSEGFGMPIVEAIACGCPVISSNTTSMPEIVGWEPGLFDPTDIDAMSQMVTRALVDADYRSALQVACQASLGRHTWDAAAHRIVWALTHHVIAPAHAAPRPPVRRLAIIGPLGDQTDAASHVRQLIDGLLSANARLEIDVFDDRPITSEPGRVGHYPLAAFGRTLSPAGYDERLYAIADAPECAPVYEAACRWPGVAWLPDGCLYRLMSAQGSASALTAFFDRWYGDRVPSKVRYASLPSAELLADHRLLCTAEIVHRSIRTLVSSPDAAQAVLLDAGPWPSSFVEVFASDVGALFPSLAG